MAQNFTGKIWRALKSFEKKKNEAAQNFLKKIRKPENFEEKNLAAWKRHEKKSCSVETSREKIEKK